MNKPFCRPITQEDDLRAVVCQRCHSRPATHILGEVREGKEYHDNPSCFKCLDEQELELLVQIPEMDILKTEGSACVI